MKDFRKLDLPTPHTLTFLKKDGAVGLKQVYSKEKWYCAASGSDVYYLHKDLILRHGTAANTSNDELYNIDSELKITDAEVDEYYAGFFDSEEEALEAYNKYYYLHAQEPGH